MVEKSHLDSEIPIIAFLGKTGAGKTSLMNAMAK